jgi:hypothetical protein
MRSLLLAFASWGWLAPALEKIFFLFTYTYPHEMPKDTSDRRLWAVKRALFGSIHALAAVIK